MGCHSDLRTVHKSSRRVKAAITRSARACADHESDPKQNRNVRRRYIYPDVAQCDAEEAYTLLKKVLSASLFCGFGVCHSNRT